MDVDKDTLTQGALIFGWLTILVVWVKRRPVAKPWVRVSLFVLPVLAILMHLLILLR